MSRPTIADWLESLHRDGVAAIDPDMALDVERLLATWATDQVKLVDAAQALAARVATNAEQYRAVRRSFEETFGEEAGRGGELRGTEAGARGEGDGGRRDVRWWVRLFGLGIMALGGWYTWHSQEPVPTGDSFTESEESATLAGSESSATPEESDGISVIEVEPAREVLLHGSRWSLATTLGFGLSTALLWALGLRWLMARTLRDEQTARGLEVRKLAIEREGTEPGELYRFKAPAPLDPSTIDAAADDLGRPGHGYEGTRLDVPRTLDYTLRAGGRPRPRFLRASRQPPLVVLVDVEEWSPTGQTYPLAHAAEWILDRWQRTGLRFERFDYVASLPTEVRHPGSGRAIDLRMLARRHGSARLLVWSRLRRLRGAPLVAWLGALRPWKRRVWIDLDPRPAVPVVGDEDGRVTAALERLAEVERSGLVRYPLTRQGLVAAARHLVADRGLPPDVSDEVVVRRGDTIQRERIEQALSQWAAAACCVPDPTWAHLDMLRTLLPDVRRVFPEARGVWWLLRWLEREGCLVETATRARDGAERQLLGRKQRITVQGRASTVEHWVTQRLVQQLHEGMSASSGVTNKIAEEERRARLAYYRCVEDPTGGVEALCQLLGTTADPLARELLQRLGHRMDVGEPRDGEHTRTRVKAALGERVPVGRIVGQRPRSWEVATALGVLVGVTTVMRWMTYEVIGVRVRPPVYEVVLPEKRDGETAASVLDPLQPIPSENLFTPSQQDVMRTSPSPATNVEHKSSKSDAVDPDTSPAADPPAPMDVKEPAASFKPGEEAPRPKTLPKAWVKIFNNTGSTTAQVRIGSKMFLSIDKNEHKLAPGKQKIKWRRSATDPWQAAGSWNFKPGKRFTVFVTQNGIAIHTST
jgi:hypothetical protein